MPESQPDAAMTVDDFLNELVNMNFPGVFHDKTTHATTKSVSTEEIQCHTVLTHLQHVEELPAVSTTRHHIMEWLSSPYVIANSTLQFMREESQYGVRWQKWRTVLSEAHVSAMMMDPLVCCFITLSLHSNLALRPIGDDYGLRNIPQQPVPGSLTKTDTYLAYCTEVDDSPGNTIPVATIELKTDGVLGQAVQALDACVAKKEFAWPPNLSANADKGVQIWTQVWNQVIRYKVDFVMLASSHLVYFCQRVDKSVLAVDGPYRRDGLGFQMAPGVDAVKKIATAKDFMLFWARAAVDAEDRNLAEEDGWQPRSRPEQVSALFRGWATVADRGVGLLLPARAMINALRRRWAVYSLAHCRAVVIRRVDGTAFEPVLRQAESLAVARTWLDRLFLCAYWMLTWFLADIVVLRVSSLAGQGIRSTAWRGVYSGVPFIIKIPHAHDSNAMVREWRALALRLPRDVSRLPIPTYHGLFDDIRGVMVTSDNGISLDQLSGDHERMRPLIEDAISSLKSAGVAPTDVSLRNSVWDGSRLTIIDFVDDQVSEGSDGW